MKLTTPQIVWHGKEPVFSADFHHSGDLWRLATGGADKDVKIWKLVREEEGKVKPVFMASLSRHSGAINVVRFSPNGELLASAGDDNVVYLWRMGEGGGASNTVSMDTGLQNKESWSIAKMLRGHVEDIYDACWSACSNLLVTGSVDNSAIIWDISKGQALCTLADSKQYVQGVTWDPIGQYIATFSNDRYLRVYSAAQKYKCVHSVNKMAAPDQEKGRQFRMWIDESLSFFFRRLTFSPDGNLLVVPAGRYENGEKATNMTYIFTKANLGKPAVCLPCPEKPSVVVKFCPKLFKLRDSIDKEKSLFSLPYRMVYAVASLDAVLMYDTQQATPFAYLSNMHYSGITDLAWSEDGLILVITSSDAYCSIVTFEPGELGVAVATEDLPKTMRESKKASEPTKNGVVSTNHENVENGQQKSTKTALTKRQKAEEEREVPSDSSISPTVVVGGGTTKHVGLTAGGGGEKKTKRRITTTIVESFLLSSSPGEKKSENQPLPSPPSSSGQTSQEEETGLTGLTGSAAADSAVSTQKSAEKKSRRIKFETLSTSPESVSSVSTDQSKPRRIALETLTSPRQQGSCDSESKSHDPGSTHSLSQTGSVSEPMDVQSVE